MTRLCNTNIIIEYKHMTDFEEDDKNKTIWVMLIDKKDNNRKAHLFRTSQFSNNIKRFKQPILKFLIINHIIHYFIIHNISIFTKYKIVYQC